MAKYAIGTILYEARIRRRIPQKELCNGICTAVTLSRIENGTQTPRRTLCEALMQRRVLPTPASFLVVSHEELEQSNLEQQIRAKLSREEYDYEELLTQYEYCSQEMDPMEEQFELYASARLQYHRTGNWKYAREELLEALGLTMPELDLRLLHETRFLTTMELVILRDIALGDYGQGKKEEAKSILLCLKNYLEHKEVDLEEKAKLYPEILCYLGGWVGAEGRNEFAYELCENGIRFCIAYDRLTFFPRLLFHKGSSLARMGRREEAMPCFRQACAIFEAMDDQKRVHQCRREMEALTEADS